MKTVKLKCGCQYAKSDSEPWTELCAEHDRIYNATRARWLRERATKTSEEPGHDECVSHDLREEAA